MLKPMVDGVRTLFLSEARDLVGKHVHLTVVDGGALFEVDADIAHLAHVSQMGPCLVTVEGGDIPIDHITYAKTA